MDPLTGIFSAVLHDMAHEDASEVKTPEVFHRRTWIFAVSAV